MSILRDIINNKRIEIEQAKRKSIFRNQTNDGPKPKRDFRKAILMNDLTVIAELKRRSPSSGTIKTDFDPTTMAGMYESAGAGAISVLTDEKFFGGRGDDIRIVKDTVSLPVLRKDFIIDEYQIVESKYMGADAILLIARILNRNTLSAFISMAKASGLDCLVETHSREEIDAALAGGAAIIGINNRDLDTLEIDLNKSLDLRKYIPAGIAAISESGLKDRTDIQLMRTAGFDAVLVGTALASADDTAVRLKELTGRGNE